MIYSACCAIVWLALSVLLDNACGDDDVVAVGKNDGGAIEPEFRPSEIGCSMVTPQQQETTVDAMPSRDFAPLFRVLLL
jgi:hypothetical protein